MPKRFSRNTLSYVLIAVGAISVLFMLFNNNSQSTSITMTDVILMAQRGDIKSVEVKGNDLDVTDINGSSFTAKKEPGSSIIEIFNEAGVPVGDTGIPVEV